MMMLDIEEAGREKERKKARERQGESIHKQGKIK